MASGTPTNPEATDAKAIVLDWFEGGPITVEHAGVVLAALDRLLTERDALKKERDEARKQRVDYWEHVTALQTAEVTLTRYRNALERIALGGPPRIDGVIARAALDGPKEEVETERGRASGDVTDAEEKDGDSRASHPRLPRSASSSVDGPKEETP